MKIAILLITSLIIASVALFFIPQTHEYMSNFLTLLSDNTIWLYYMLLTSYSLPIWVLLIISILAIITIVRVLLLFTNSSKEEYTKYVEDSIYNAKWRWKWTKSEIVNIECYCPKCDSVLVYDESSCHTRYTDVAKTDFICENCNSQLVTTIHGGNKKYAINAIKREIERRIRTNEYKTVINKSI